MEYHVEDGILYYNTTVLGSASLLFIDARQDTAACEGVEAMRLEVGDDVFVTPEGKVVVVEEKRVGDLYSSWKSRRLQRQLRHALQAADIAVLGLRGAFVSLHELPSEVWIDVLKWQALGGVIGFLPSLPQRCVATLMEWRAVLRPKQALLSILAGDDRGRVRGDGTVMEKALRRMLKHVGPVRAAKIAGYFNQDWRAAWSAGDKEWRKAGADERVLKQVRELCGN